MITYQDLLTIGESDIERIAFCKKAINEHQASKLYKTAQIADEYAKHRNRTIIEYQKLLYTVSGHAVPDNWSANYKLASNFFDLFVTQENQYLFGNGVAWDNESTGEALGDTFDRRLQEAGRKALVGGVSFGFYNLDHLEVFGVLEFAPLYDEENGALRAGIRFWQIDTSKPLRATLYEEDGYTDYIWHKGEGSVLHDKRPYIVNTSYTEADENAIYDGENYPTFPIVPFWGNPNHQSELVGMREQIDAYDLIKSGFANDLDDVSQIFWTVSNAGGMDDIDLAQFVQRMKTVKAAAVDDGEQVQAHTAEIPYSAREILLDRLRKDMYRDYRALDTEAIAGGAITATQIKANYEPVNGKSDEYEYCAIDFIKGILTVAGLDDNPTFTRSVLVNQSENIQDIISAAEFLPKEYVAEKLLTLLGDADRVEEILNQIAQNEIDRGFLDGGEGGEE